MVGAYQVQCLHQNLFIEGKNVTIVITSGEPAGIGPDIILKAASRKVLSAVVLGDVDFLSRRAALLGVDVRIEVFDGSALLPEVGVVYVQHIPLKQEVIPGTPHPENAEYILAQLDAAVQGCMNGYYSAMVTAPVAKSVICEGGYFFLGHTEYIAELTQTKQVVMMLACQEMRVALVTTHLPLKDVAKAITRYRLEQTILTVRASLQNQFGIKSPKIMIAGLNPHAGEHGYLGREEIDVMTPVLSQFNSEKVIGPVAADTMFSQENCKEIDAFIAMYHDQGLSVLKYAGFGQAANISLGLPIIRTSVDHGTAFSLAGTLKVDDESLCYAIKQADMMIKCSIRSSMV